MTTKTSPSRWVEQKLLPTGRVLTYPPLTKEERAVMKVLSGGKGLCISRYALSWAFYNAKGKDYRKMREVVRRMAKAPHLELIECIIADEEETA